MPPSFEQRNRTIYRTCVLSSKYLFFNKLSRIKMFLTTKISFHLEQLMKVVHDVKTDFIKSIRLFVHGNSFFCKTISIYLNDFF